MPLSDREGSITSYTEATLLFHTAGLLSLLIQTDNLQYSLKMSSFPSIHSDGSFRHIQEFSFSDTKFHLRFPRVHPIQEKNLYPMTVKGGPPSNKRILSGGPRKLPQENTPTSNPS